ncbi:MAG: RNA 2',3'-cyclic phosphodiesterase [Bacteroidales bacterium]|nr:RNA 2',3'-cyclic phosphodiesterase [Bacteroidales bacterium]
MKRIFAAVKIAPDANFSSVYNQLKTALRHDRINWVPLHNIHLTLKFFGEVHDEQVEAIDEILKQVAVRHKSFDMELFGTGIFGSSYDPRVVWFGIRHSEQISALAADVLDAVTPIGFPRDRQNFRPHLTIGRVKHITDKNIFQQTIRKHSNSLIQVVKVDSFGLIESKLRPQGSAYMALASYRLEAR